MFYGVKNSVFRGVTFTLQILGFWKSCKNKKQMIISNTSGLSLMEEQEHYCRD